MFPFCFSYPFFLGIVHASYMFILRNPCDFLEGNSANHAIELLRQKGVPESHIIFLNLISVSYSIPQCWLIYMLLSIINPIHWFLVCYIGFRHLRGYNAFANGSRPWKSSPQRLTCHWMKNSVLFRDWGSLVIVTLARTIDHSSSKSRNYVYNWMKLDTYTARWNIKPVCISVVSLIYNYREVGCFFSLVLYLLRLLFFFDLISV